MMTTTTAATTDAHHPIVNCSARRTSWKRRRRSTATTIPRRASSSSSSCIHTRWSIAFTFGTISVLVGLSMLLLLLAGDNGDLKRAHGGVLYGNSGDGRGGARRYGGRINHRVLHPVVSREDYVLGGRGGGSGGDVGGWPSSASSEPSVVEDDESADQEDTPAAMTEVQEAEMVDYSDRSCGDILAATPPSSSARCIYAQSCDGGQGILLPSFFCRNNDGDGQRGAWHIVSTVLLLTAIALTVLPLLFRLLSTTSESYFAPTLEHLAHALQLPPRFAGATLLALGNGAPDVSASYHAILSDPAAGYRLSLGALTGGAMFVGTVVAGGIVRVSSLSSAGDDSGGASSPSGRDTRGDDHGDEGSRGRATDGEGGTPTTGMAVSASATAVRYRGALLRDVVAYALGLLAVYRTLRRGVATQGDVQLYFALYGAYVMTVLIADVFHRTVTLPRLRKASSAFAALAAAAERDVEDGMKEAKATAIVDDSKTASDSTGSSLSGEEDDDAEEGQDGLGALSDDGGAPPFVGQVLLSLSNYSVRDVAAVIAEAGSGGGVASAGPSVVVDDERIGTLHGPGGVLDDPHHHHHQTYHHAVPHHPPDGEACCRGGNNADGIGPDETIPIINACPMHQYHGSVSIDRDRGEAEEPPYDECTWQGWGRALRDAGRDLRRRLSDLWDDVLFDDDGCGRSWIDVYLSILELPFAVLRTATVPLPCGGYYDRSVVAASLSLSPFWVVPYVASIAGGDGDDFDVVTPLVWSLLVSFAASATVVRFAGEREMPVAVAVPIALYGFFVAATWIDVIGDHLVRVLEFLGIICRIPSPVMGITVLSWGNSMGDLSTNLTMARRGLANMAITACFAGPVFNLLVSLGSGFGAALAAKGGSEGLAVSLFPSAETGAFFLLCNCTMMIACGIVLYGREIPQWHSCTMLGLYASYIVVSVVIALEFSLEPT